MPLGQNARRSLIAIVSTVMAAGCSAVPPSSRLVPRTADIRTNTNPDRGPSTLADLDEPAGVRKLAFDSLDEISPLPPALQAPNAPIELPASLPAGPTQAAPARSEAPKLDEAVTRAVARTVAADEVAKPPEPDPTKPSPSLLPPVKPEPPRETRPPAPAPAVRSPEPARPPAEPASPEEIWRDGVQTLRGVARDRLKLSREELKPGSPNWVVRDRLLGWLAEPDIDPDARSAADVAQGRAVLKGLAAVIDPTAPAATRGAEIRDAVATLEARAPLEITELRLCRKVHGFGNIEPLEPASRKAGQAVVVYCELAGLAYEPSGPSFRSRVSAEVELIAEGAETPAWSHSLGTGEDACRRRRRDFFVGHMFTLPESLAAGTYRLRVTEKDLVTDHVATRETPIHIVK